MIFGSQAAKFWYPDFREPQDTDVMSESGRMERKEQHYWVPTFQDIISSNKHSQYVDPEFLYAIKCSHFKWDIHWQKTANDILFFQRKGLKLNRELYKKLHKDFIGIHGKRWASLKGKDSDSFFMDAVTRKYNHDELHECVATYDKPLYFSILKHPETKSVECSEEKFNALSHKDQLLVVQEEVWVTALERYLIPTNFTHGDNLAYAKSLMKLITTMSSGWFSIFMIENYQYLYKNTDWTFIKKFKEKYTL
jgi:hypothetical protein